MLKQLLDEVRARLQWIVSLELPNADMHLSEPLQEILSEVQKDPTCLPDPLAELTVMIHPEQVNLLSYARTRGYSNTIELIQSIDAARLPLAPFVHMTQMFTQLGLQCVNAGMNADAQQNTTPQYLNNNPHESNNYQVFH